MKVYDIPTGNDISIFGMEGLYQQGGSWRCSFKLVNYENEINKINHKRLLQLSFYFFCSEFHALINWQFQFYDTIYGNEGYHSNKALSFRKVSVFNKYSFDNLMHIDIFF